MIKKLNALLDSDERGVSPVIGVILMVAITVILAAVIGTFVLGLGQNTQQTPQASVTISDANTDYTESGSEEMFDLSHDSGDSIKFGDLRIVIRNADTNAIVADLDAASFDTGGSSYTAKINGRNQVTGGVDYGVGDVLTFKTLASPGTPASDNTKYKVTVIHKPSDSTIASSTVQLS